jgi:flagella synthesis protein FlgN
MKTLLDHLKAQTACCEELLAMLAQEEEAMTQRRFAELQETTARKLQALDRLAELDGRREKALSAAGFEPGPAGANAAAAAHGPAASQAWSGLLALAERARAHNLRNGTIVCAQLDFTQKALNFLQASAQHFYGPDGIRKTTAGAGTRLALG